jgi:hypothetical protein
MLCHFLSPYPFPPGLLRLHSKHDVFWRKHESAKRPCPSESETTTSRDLLFCCVSVLAVSEAFTATRASDI